MDTFAQDLRYAVRTLAGARGFALTTILTLALGIGLTTAIYSVVAAVVLRPLPFPEPDRFVIPKTLDLAGDDRWSVTYADYRDWVDARVFEHVAVFQQTDADLT